MMAGGKGERFWPKSKAKSPKQCLSIFGDKSLIQESIERLTKLISADNIFISTNIKMSKIIKKQIAIKEENYILEPVAKNTAACIGLSCIKILNLDAEAVVAMVPSDAVIKDSDSYLNHLDMAFAFAEKNDKIVLIGIKPTYPNTGLGYIHYGEKIEEVNSVTISEVKNFKEKPDLETARQFLAAGNYLWNGGMFVCKAKVMIDAIQEHIPKLYEGLQKIKESNFDPITTKKVFKKLDSISIDFGVIEKVNNLAVVIGNFDWNDVGDWRSLESVFDKDSDGNIIKGEFYGLDVKDSIIYGDKLVTAIGIKDLIIVNTGKEILVADKNYAQDVKKLLEKIPKKYK